MATRAPADRGPMTAPAGSAVRVEPFDQYNRELVANVHPPGWVNPEPKPRYHLVVIGAGTAGLVSGSIAAGLGASVALVERHLMGGDCLNVGCVPSKGLSARLAPGRQPPIRGPLSAAPRWPAPVISPRPWSGCGSFAPASARSTGPRATGTSGSTCSWAKAASPAGTRSWWTARCSASGGRSSPPGPGPPHHRFRASSRPAFSPTKPSSR